MRWTGQANFQGIASTNGYFFKKNGRGKLADYLILQESDKPKQEVLVCFVSLIDIRIGAFWLEAMILVGEKCAPAGSHV
jgi:hypothetical protein